MNKNAMYITAGPLIAGLITLALLMPSDDVEGAPSIPRDSSTETDSISGTIRKLNESEISSAAERIAEHYNRDFSSTPSEPAIKTKARADRRQVRIWTLLRVGRELTRGELSKYRDDLHKNIATDICKNFGQSQEFRSGLYFTYVHESDVGQLLADTNFSHSTCNQLPVDEPPDDGQLVYRTKGKRPEKEIYKPATTQVSPQDYAQIVGWKKTKAGHYDEANADDYNPFVFTNYCRSRLILTVRYMDPFGAWHLVTGWIVEPGEKKILRDLDGNQIQSAHHEWFYQADVRLNDNKHWGTYEFYHKGAGRTFEMKKKLNDRLPKRYEWSECPP